MVRRPPFSYTIRGEKLVVKYVECTSSSSIRKLAEPGLSPVALARNATVSPASTCWSSTGEIWSVPVAEGRPAGIVTLTGETVR